MPNTSPAPGRSSARLTLPLVAILLASVGTSALWLNRRIAADRDMAVALAGAMTAPRAVFDGRSLEARFDLAVEELAAERRESAPQIRAALDRFASGDLIGLKHTGYDAFLAQLATRRFELAIATVRDLANSAKTTPSPAQPAWRLFALAGTLEFARARAIAAEPLLQQAFDLANRADALDRPEAAGLLTAVGALKLSRSAASEAEPYLRRAAALLRDTPGADLRDRARALNHYAQSIAAQGFPEEAEPLSSQALALAAEYRRTTGRPDTDQAQFEENYRKILRDRGVAEAEVEAQLRSLLQR